MDLLLSHSVISGFLSNETPHHITGMLHLSGQAVPTLIELQGNFISDIAGCRVQFLNPHNTVPAPAMADTMKGIAGEITASRRLRRLPRRHESPSIVPASGKERGPAMQNVLFMEWFTLDGIRVQMMAHHWHVQCSAPTWKLSPEEEQEQMRRIRANRRSHLLRGFPRTC